MSSKPVDQMWLNPARAQDLTQGERYRVMDYSLHPRGQLYSYDPMCTHAGCHPLSRATVPKYSIISHAHLDTGTARMNIKPVAARNMTHGEGVETKWGRKSYYAKL